MRWVVPAAGAAAAVLAVLLSLGAAWGPIRELDLDLLSRVLIRSVRLDVRLLGDHVTHMADLSRALLLSAGIVAVGLALRRFRETMGAVVLLVGANVSTQLLQQTHSDAPVLLRGVIPVDGAYPSGHITFAAAAAASLVLVVPGAVRPLAAACGCGFVVAQGLALLIVNTHLPSHLVGGILVTCVWTAVAVVGLRELDARVPRRADPPPRPAGWARFAPAALGGLIALVTGAAILSTAGGDLERYVRAYGTFAAQAAGAVGAFVMGLTAAFYWIWWVHRSTTIPLGGPETDGGLKR